MKGENNGTQPRHVKEIAVAKATSGKSVKHVSDAIMFDVIDSMIPSLAKKYREQFGSSQEKKVA